MNKPDQNLEQLRQAVLQQRLQKQMKSRGAMVQPQGIGPADRSQPLPLSFAQQRLWFIDQLDQAGGSAYHMPAGFRLHGPLDRAALRAALDHIVLRHESLRTVFVSVDGTPQQRIAGPESGFALTERDLGQMDSLEQSALVDAIRVEEAGRAFDLSTGPLIRGQLLRLGEDDHLLLVTQHHIVSDGWSIGVLVQEFSALYNAFSRHQPTPLPPLPIQYADYAVWQRQWLQGEVLERQVAFWKSRLAGAPELLALPTDRARPAMQSYAGAVVAFSLPAELSDSIKALARQHGASLFMTLMAGWALLMSRISGQKDIVVGTPVANRQHGETATLIGFLANTLALRFDFASEPTVAELLEQVKTHTLAAFEHQDLPFEQVVEALQPARSMSYSPLFQVIMSLEQGAGSHSLDMNGLSISRVTETHDAAQFDLNLALVEVDGTIEGTLRYATDLFDAGTVDNLVKYFRHVLSAMTADPAQRVIQLPLMDAAGRAQVLLGFNDTLRSYPHEALIHQLFEGQAERTPDAVALTFGALQVSYAELNRRANRVAHRLLALGTKADDRVAICADRGVDLIVGLLGILKAGAAYVPLDPDYPAERLAFMLADSAPVAILAQATLCAPLAELSPAPLLLLDDPELASQPETNPAAAGLTARHLAYIIYTSGSTGEPKGVMVEHRNVVRLVINNPYAAVTSADCVAQCANVAFDASTWEIWSALLNGGRLHAIPQEVLLDPPRFKQALVEANITALWLTVGLFNEYVDLLGEALGNLRYLLVGGDALDPRIIGRFLAGPHAPEHLINGYGPTEATTFATTHAIASVADESRSIPIGRPIGNTQIYILDECGQPTAIGVPGEIYVGGDGVARGYLNRPELTAERFLHDPFSEQPDGRLYKTGDLGRWTTHGEIEFLGRLDHQVKLRGFRIELGEIEAKLSACAGVREAVVLAREDEHGGKRLVAYVTAHAGAELPVAGLRSQMEMALPDYMVPSAYVVLDALPLTSNGKLDRKALPAPDLSALLTLAYEAPLGRLEVLVAQVWCELLHLERVGRNDNFFQLGGHSLMAVQLTSRMRDALGVELALRDLFVQPVLADFAALAGRALQSTQSAIECVDRSQPLPLSFAQQRLWFIDQLDQSGGAAYHMPAALRLRGTLDRGALRSALDRIVARHENLRTRFIEVNGTPQQSIAGADIGFALEERDLSALHAAEQAMQIEAIGDDEAGQGFDLATGPLIRGQLLHLGSDDHLLLITQHHIISDGWSIGVLVRELSTLYAAFSQGQSDPLPALPIQYADYALWQRQWLAGEVLERQTAFWKFFLAGAPALLELPADRPRPAVQSYRGDMVPLELSAELTGSLKAFGQRHGATLPMTLLAAWGLLLSRLSGQSDVVIGTPVANRPRSELEGLIGLFVNMLAMRVRTDDTLTVAGLLAQVKASCLEAFEHQDMPFEQAVAALQPVRSLAHSPVFQVSLTVNDDAFSGRDLALSGLDLSNHALPHTTAQFDMSLIVSDHDGVLSGELIYATDLFDRERMLRMVAQFESLLADMVADDQQAVHRLSLLSAAERRQVLVDFNRTAAAFPHEQPIHQRFEEQAAATPEAIAIVAGARQMSYGELNTRANRLAHHLIGLGVRPDTRVAICMERGPDLMVGLLGILKAGGAYVPLDPNYPSERLAYMLDDCAPVALLTQASLQDDLPASSRMHTVVLDDEFGDVSAIARQSASNPAVAGLTSRHLAYIIYTSGSTGQPKGVMIEHHSVLRLVINNPFAQITASDCVAHCANIAFDASTWEVWAPLLNGGRVLMIPHATVLDPEQFRATLAEGQASAIFLTTALFNHYAELLTPILSRFRFVLFGGEQADIGPVALVKRQASPAHLLHVYGPTETTTFASAYEIESIAEGATLLPIGGPIGNTTIYLLDPHGQPVPIGVPGELHIGGPGVARGYLNQPALTAARFIDDPFSDVAGARLYKTGDLGRWTAQGAIEFLGRNDQQVKIRGFRIELGEIETVLGRYPGLRDLAVILREDKPGEKRLVAYYTLDEDSAAGAITAELLRSHLGAQLPEYMVPAAYILLDSLPLNANGKLDRRALPVPDDQAYAMQAYQAPSNATETALCQIWCEVLNLAQVGVNDNFFDVGGDSIRSIAIVTQAKAMGLGLAVVDLFAHPTVSSLAHALAQRHAPVAAAAAAPAISEEDRAKLPQNIEDAYPMTMLQMGMVFHNQVGGQDSLYHDVFSHRVHLPVWNEPVMRAVLKAMSLKHPILRTSLDIGSYSEPLQLVHRDAQVSLKVHDLTELDAEAQDRLISEFFEHERHAPIQLQHAPLLRLFVHVRDTTTVQFTLSLHHAILDGWSVAALQTELFNTYHTMLARGETDVTLAPLLVTPRTTALKEKQTLASSAHQTFWRDYLADGVQAVLPPADGDIETGPERVRGAYLSTEVAAGLRKLSSSLSVPLRTVLLAAHMRVQAMLLGVSDVTTGLVSNMRPEEADGDKVLGLFLNTLPFRLKVDGSSWSALVQQVYQTELAVMQYRDYPYFQLRRDNGAAAHYDVTFNFTNFHVYESLATTQRDDGLKLAYEATGFPLDINFNSSARGIHVEVAPGTLSTRQAERILAYYLAALAAMVADAEARHDSCDLMASAERDWLLRSRAAPTAAVEGGLLMHQRFEAQAAATPDAIALVFEQSADESAAQSLSYRELNQRADQIAQRLLALGIQANDRVAVCAARGPDAIAGMLGVLKSGGAYVPLDPHYPAERLAFMLADSAPVALLTQQALLATIPAQSLPVVLLDDLTLSAEQPPTGMRATPANLAGHHLAYVIYTSGSTGQPKGVMVQHANVVNLASWHAEAAGLTPADRVLQFASHSFDVSVGEIFPALFSGATLVLRPGHITAPDAAFLAFLDRHRITVCDLPTAFWHQWVAEVTQGYSRLGTALRLVITGGDKPESAQLRQWFAHPSTRACRWMNAYGPTEATVTASAIMYDQHAVLPDGAIPIGQPIAGTRIYVLNDFGQLAPMGVVGEIHIGGAGVASGYLGRPELTDERFIADPFVAGERVYKTGDLGRWMPDGNLEFLGRNDAQVKIRGHRIELGEIEHKLAACAGVREAVVLAREERAGDKQLVAYVTVEPGAALTAATLREALAAQLPAHMQPSAIVFLERLPLMPNGKLDRKALPAAGTAASVAHEFEAPVGPVETAIAGIWQELLGRELIGRHENFFELGGHSLNVVLLAERMRRAGYQIAASAVFAAPTVAAMALAAVRDASGAPAFEVARNLIGIDATQIRPDMLPLVSLSQAEIDGIIAHVPGGVANVQDIYPLSPLQEGILFHHLLDTQNDSYVLRNSLVFDERARLDDFVAALELIVNRHDILRSAIHWAGLSRPVQVVLRRTTLAVEWLTLGEQAGTGSDATQRFLELTEPSGVRFDLSQAPLLKVLIAQDPGSGACFLSLLSHHIVGDHAAVEIMINELQALLHGRADLLPTPLPYRNFIAQHLADDPLAHEAYFRRVLGDFSEPTAVFGVVDAQVGSSAIDEVHVAFDPVLAHATRQQARRLGVTPAVIFHVATALVLERCSGRTDLVFGSVMSGRLQGTQATSQIMGMFINTLPIRVRIGGGNVEELVRSTYASLGELVAHEQASLVLAKRCSGVSGALPLFTTLLNFRHSHRDTSNDVLASPEDTWQGIRVLTSDERTNYPLTFNVDDLGEDFSASVQCVRSISAERLAHYFQSAVSALVTALQMAPRMSVATLDVLGLDERELLLNGFNNTQRPYPHNALLHELVEQQVAARPSAIAVKFEGQELSYAELNRRSNQLAHRLVAMGIAPDDRVAICVERSLEMVIGLLAILKAGAGYVPLDPSYPADRLAWMLADCTPKCLLTQQSLTGVLPDGLLPVLVLDSPALQAGLAGNSGDNLDAATLGLTAEHMAYVIYTSGSTGLPKGVINQHHGVVNRLTWAQSAYQLGHDDVVLQKTPFGFDVSVWEFFLPLLAGARMVVARPGAHRNPQYLREIIDAEGITTLHFVPSMLPAFLGEVSPGTCGSVRRVKCSGEALPYAEQLRFAAVLPHAELHNLYGPTEAAIDVTSWHCVADRHPGIVPIGSPIANTSIYILDESGRPSPVGVAGEIHIGGVGVARGYLNRPQLTAERFIRDPFSVDSSARLYKTGDLGRWLPDGNVEYLGRNDFQVKIRGFRIELGEIEARLLECQDVREAVVLARNDGAGASRLVAYIVTEGADGGQGNPELWRSQLLQHLPDYMVPAAYVQLDALPLTTNGKLDRAALPSPDGAAYSAPDYVAPRTDTETALCDIWCDILVRDQVGVNDNFFDVGGDSIRSIAIVTRAKSCGLDLAVLDLFTYPTVALLAQALRERTGQANGPVEDPALAEADRIQLPDGIEDAYPANMLQIGMIFHSQLSPGDGLYHDVFSQCVELPRWSEPTLLAVLDGMTRKHPVLRTAFDLGSYSEPMQLVQRQAQIPLTVNDMRGVADAEQDRQILQLVEAERQSSFDLAAAPLLRVFVHVRSEQAVQFTLSLHHAIMDGWSVASFLTELFNEYFRLLESGATQPALQALAVTPRVAALKERRALASQSHKEFWRAYLADHVQSALPLADGAPEPALQRTRSFVLPEDIAQGLQDLASEVAVPLRTVLLAVHMRVLSLLSGQTDVTTGLVSNVRPEQTDGDKVLGLFLNTLPFRLRLDATSWKGLIRQTYASELAVMQHRDYPYSQMHADNHRVAHYEAVFNYTNFHVFDQLSSSAKSSGLTVSYEATGHGLGVNFARSASGILVELNPGSLSARQTEQILDYYAAALRAIAQDPDADHQVANLLGTQELHQLQHEFNDTHCDYPRDQLIHQLFEEQVARQPQAVALSFGTTVLTYDQLNRRANQIAHRLLALGVKPDARVAICAERGIELIAGLLGILKAGGAYVPLDPGYPAERLCHMLDDANPVAVLTQSPLLERLQLQATPVLLLDDLSSLDGQADSNPQPAALGLRAQHLAYVVYTSGSTGKPKGVMVQHDSLCNLTRAQIAAFGVGDGKRVLQFVSVSFDVCTSEVTMALCSGACLVLASTTALLPGDPLLDLLRAERISHVSLPAAVLTVLPEHAPLPDLEVVLVGGDVLPPAVASAWSTRIALFNCYGPTETTVCATYYRCDGAEARSVPIGRPLANTQMYVLDALLRPVPVGVTGDIYIGGDGVARGYLGQPQLTEERFIANPFQPGRRLYKSGDRGRWLRDGALEFAGRDDFQVKIRGFRIELGEIESALAACHGVREAVVMARDDGSGDKRLIGYITAQAGAAPLADELRAQLAQSLAEHMVPRAIVVMDEFPLTSNGKVDRTALPEPVMARGNADYVAPRDELEAALAQHWAEALKLDRIGVHDSFFELGGNSLLIVKLHSRLSALHPGRLAIADYFKHTTVARLASHIRSGADSTSRVSASLSRAEQRKSRLAVQRPGRGRQTQRETADAARDEQ